MPLLLAFLGLAITHVTLIDTRTGQARPDVTVVITGDRISAVTESRRPKLPPGAQILDGRGKFLIPGLWDMHAHLFATVPVDPDDPAPRDFFVPRLVASGITGVRSMWDHPAAIRKLRADPASPRIVACGPIVDGPQPYVPGSIACANAQQGREAVDRLKGEGSDFVKVYSLLPREAYLGIVEQARKTGLPVAGHVPNSVTFEEASDAGQKSIEHLMRLDALDPQRLPTLLAKFVKNSTWVAPTLAVHRAVAWFGDPEFMRDPRLDSLPPLLLQFWKSGPAAINPSQDPGARRLKFEAQLQLVGAMHRAGVRILAGTDTPNPYVFPGSSLHDELELLVKAGLTPLEALQAATIRPAEYLGLEDRLGSIAPGRFADLVLLEANPLSNIANTRRIAAVILNGQLRKPRADGAGLVH